MKTLYEAIKKHFGQAIAEAYVSNYVARRLDKTLPGKKHVLSEKQLRQEAMEKPLLLKANGDPYISLCTTFMWDRTTEGEAMWRYVEQKLKQIYIDKK